MNELDRDEVLNLLRTVRNVIAGLRLEIQGDGRRHMDTSDFAINELKRLSDAIEHLAQYLNIPPG
jgi:hypothetical protein